MTVVWWLATPAIYAAYRLVAGDVSYEVSKYSEDAELIFAVALARLAASARTTLCD